ncbi:MAG: glycosyltransferase [Pseudomonadota bacterium]|nr:glycosyltransferase [Pseudomonadota bacterium]
MKICIVVGVYPNLSETFVRSQVEGLARRGHEVEVLCRHVNAGAGGCVVRIRRWWGPLSALSAPVEMLSYRLGHKAQRMLDQIHRQYFRRFDVILAHFGHTGARVASTLAGMERAPPLVTIYHGYDVATVAHENGMWRYRQLFDVGALHLPVNDAFRDMLVAGGAPPKRTVVHRVGTEFRPAAPAPDQPATGMRFLSVCRLTEKKGITYAISALERLAKDRPDLDWRYEIVGAGELDELLRRQASASTVSDRIVFLGAQPHQEVKRLMQVADVFLLPSVTAENGDSEGVPVSLMEAMASGVLVVSTSHSGIPELVEDGESGFLAPERDVGALAAKIAAAADAAGNPTIRRAAADRIEHYFNSDVQLEELERLLNGVGRHRVLSEEYA